MVGMALLFVQLVVVLAEWLVQQPGPPVQLRGVSAVDARTAWASGQKGTVLRTLDGGMSWHAIPVPDSASLDFRDIQAFSASSAIVMSAGPGEASRLYRTTDGGEHWTPVLRNPDAKGFFDAIAFWDERRGLLIGDPVDGRFVIMRTGNRGATWNRVPDRGMPPAREGEGAFAASGTCIATGPGGRAWFGTGGEKGGRVFRSDDYGNSWIAVETPIRRDGAAAGIFSIAFDGEAHGVAVGGEYQHPREDRDNVIISGDSGRTWRAATGRRPGGYREAVAWVPGRPNRLLTTGPNGSDASDDGGDNWSPVSGGFHAISFAPDGTGWAAGAAGSVAKLAR